jgi:hypothetical protein
MKTQEIIKYLITKPNDESKFVTESYEEAKISFEEGCLVTEVHTMKWNPLPSTRSSTTVVIDWL